MPRDPPRNFLLFYPLAVPGSDYYIHHFRGGRGGGRHGLKLSAKLAHLLETIRSAVRRLWQSQIVLFRSLLLLFLSFPGGPDMAWNCQQSWPAWRSRTACCCRNSPTHPPQLHPRYCQASKRPAHHRLAHLLPAVLMEVMLEASWRRRKRKGNEKREARRTKWKTMKKVLL